MTDDQEVNLMCILTLILTILVVGFIAYQIIKYTLYGIIFLTAMMMAIL